jgi:hypothetical protein
VLIPTTVNSRQQLYCTVISIVCQRMVYFSTFHSITSYDIILWGSSTYSNIIFKTQKRMVRIITNSGKKDSCRNLLKKLWILPLQSQYLFSLFMSVVKNKDLFKITWILIVLTQDLIMTYIFCSKFCSISERSMVLWY